MEGVIYSDNDSDQTIDAIEQLLYLNCRHVWVWCRSFKLYEEFMNEHWENNVHFKYDINVKSIGDCLRDLYFQDVSRDKLLIIGNINHIPKKMSLFKMNISKIDGVILFGKGNVGYQLDNNRISKYEWTNLDEKGRALDIAFCNTSILHIFYENFDCDSFHDILLADPIKHSFFIKMDKRIKLYDEPINENIITCDFINELKNMMDINPENAQLELRSLRLAYKLSHSDLLESLKLLGASDELLLSVT